jgi:hypothetical protein
MPDRLRYANHCLNPKCCARGTGRAPQPDRAPSLARSDPEAPWPHILNCAPIRFLWMKIQNASSCPPFSCERPAGWRTCDTADSQVCATVRSSEPSPKSAKQWAIRPCNLFLHFPFQGMKANTGDDMTSGRPSIASRRGDSWSQEFSMIFEGFSSATSHEENEGPLGA